MTKTHKRLAPKTPYALPTNPKDLVAQNRLDMSIVPETFLIELTLAFYEGALKYGRFNWRMRPVKASIYLSAFDRHILKFKAGEERDRKTGVHHLGYAGCCVAIMYDAKMYGTLVDDRAPRGLSNPDISAWLDGEIVKRITKLQDLFKHEKPKQYTISDNIWDDVGNEIEGRRTLATKRKGRSKSRPIK